MELLLALLAVNDASLTQCKSFLMAKEKAPEEYILNQSIDQDSVAKIDGTIGSMFLDIVLLRKDAPAIIQIHENRTKLDILTYSQLCHEVQLLAHRLIVEYDVHVGDVICQCMERSFDMIIGFLAILLVGAVYCPLNPTDPKDRLSLLIETTKARLILLHNPTEQIFQHVHPQINRFTFNHNDCK